MTVVIWFTVKRNAPHVTAGEDAFLGGYLRAREVKGFLDIFDVHVHCGL